MDTQIDLTKVVGINFDGTKWRDFEINFLRNNYYNKSIHIISEFLHRSIRSIYIKARRLNLKTNMKRGEKEGYIVWSKGKNKFNEPSIMDSSKKISETRKNLFKLGILNLNGINNPMYGKVSWNRGLTKETDERVKKYSGKNAKKANYSMLGKKHKESSKIIIGFKRKEWIINNPEKEKQRNIKHSNTLKEMYKDKTFSSYILSKKLEGMIKRPTSFEQKIIILCSKYRLPFIYTGDGRILIGYKNPDFVDEKDKIVIEVFLNYFKIRDYGSVEDYIKERGEHYKKYGYKCIFIREEEIKDKDWENICLNKINNFCKEVK